MTRILALWGLTIFHSTAGVSINFVDFSNSLTNLAGPGASSGGNGLTWGVVVDADSNGVAPLELALDRGSTLADGEEVTPGDYYFNGGTTTDVPAGFLEPGPGAPFTDGPIDPYAIPEIPAGARFALVWFEPGIAAGGPLLPGTRYGILEHPAFILPSDGSTVDYSSSFAGPNPVRPADQTVTVLPPSDLATSILGIDPGGGEPVTRHLAFTFTARETTLSAISVSLQKSTGLGSWTTVSSSPSVFRDDGDTRVLQFVDPDPLGTDPRRFLRLSITP